MQVHPYLFFSGNCEEALEFYKKALGAEVQMMMRYKESPEPPPADKVPANWSEKIMHANVRIGETQVMASDGCPQEGAGFKNFSLTISAADEADTDRLFFSRRFGMVTDKFGLCWMVGVFEQSAQAAA
jgi:PhnB protein